MISVHMGYFNVHFVHISTFSWSEWAPHPSPGRTQGTPRITLRRERRDGNLDLYDYRRTVGEFSLIRKF